ncbi:AsnC family transcriptional regulator [Tistrella bauzanensis]|uniref:AsnC family transcriptional regulator n=1 Tax=Tistrella bauzanensis TaxID=657419 RepID=A0ABQ1IE26_9PROT|nr:Lrp/AsnC family transcriptional regulator [Tistrella bauzanensis]GGB33838.1 AsnC family transcriptional regulator [Tistrella bauzanensis]
MKLDEIDRRILRALQRDARIQNVDLAREVGLTPSPCLRRVRLLEQAGVIRRYVAVLDPAQVGAGLSLFVRVWLKAQDVETIDSFIAAVERIPEIVDCYIMLGDCDFLLRVVAADLDDYRRIQAAHLGRLPGVQNLKTEVPSQTVKQSHALPLR